MDKLKVGMVGSAFIADFHYNGFKKNNEAEIVGMTTGSNTDRLEAKCKKWGIKAYESYEKMLNDTNIDAVIIGTPNHLHYKQITAALNNGKHVLAEKPVVTNYRHLDEISNLAEKKGLVLFPAHNFIYRESVIKAKEMIDSGKLGKIIRASFISTHTISEEHATGWRAKKNISKGGALMDSGHHLVYMSLYLMGFPEKLQAFKNNLLLKNMEVEDIAQINILYPNNAIGCVMQSWTSDYGKGINGIKIFGNKGQIRITDALYFNGNKMSDDVDYGVSFYNQSKHFTKAILDGERPLSTLDDVKRTLEVIYGAYKSSEEDIVVSF